MKASAERIAAYRDFCEGVIDLVLEESHGRDEKHAMAQETAITAMAEYLQKQTGAAYLSPMRSFANLDDEGCTSLGALIHRVVAEAGYWPSVGADDGLREDAVTNQLALMRKNMRDITISR